jgi:hypothetical protein
MHNVDMFSTVPSQQANNELVLSSVCAAYFLDCFLSLAQPQPALLMPSIFFYHSHSLSPRCLLPQSSSTSLTGQHTA